MTAQSATAGNSGNALQVLTQLAGEVCGGQPMLRSLRKIQGEVASQPVAAVVARVADDVEGGATLSSAMAKHPGTFSPSVLVLVEAGEKAGILDHVLLLIVECAWRYPGRVV